MTDLYQPDVQDILDRNEDMQDMVSRLAGDFQAFQTVLDVATAEFDTPEGVSQSSCAAIVATRKTIRKELYKLVDKFGTTSGRLVFFLPEGMSEGDSPPCEC